MGFSSRVDLLWLDTSSMDPPGWGAYSVTSREGVDFRLATKHSTSRPPATTANEQLGTVGSCDRPCLGSHPEPASNATARRSTLSVWPVGTETLTSDPCT